MMRPLRAFFMFMAESVLLKLTSCNFLLLSSVSVGGTHERVKDLRVQSDEFFLTVPV